MKILLKVGTAPILGPYRNIFSMTFKEKVYAHCVALLDDKINSLQKIVAELEEGSENDSKSSVGDKHETARAMMQLEQEKISTQLKELFTQRAELEKLAFVSGAEIKKGSLVKTNRGYMFFAISLGKINVEREHVMVLSLQSPVGSKLAGLKVGDSAELYGVYYRAEEIT